MVTTAFVWALDHVMSLRASLRSERGQDLIEYALLGGLIALTLMAVAVLAAMSGAVQSMAAGIGNCIDFSASVCAPF